jgi:hypothetical protein
MFIKIFKDFLHDKARIRDKKRKEKRKYNSKRTKKRKKLLPYGYECRRIHKLIYTTSLFHGT